MEQYYMMGPTNRQYVSADFISALKLYVSGELYTTSKLPL